MKKPIFCSAAEAEAAFYEALARSDLEAMMAVWSEDDEVVCIHPDGPRLVGLNAVRESWRQLFATGVRLRIDTSQHVVCASMLLTIHSVIERVSIEGERSQYPPMIATNAYARGAMGWRMLLHHTSTAPDVAASATLAETPHIVH